MSEAPPTVHEAAASCDRAQEVGLRWLRPLPHSPAAWRAGVCCRQEVGESWGPADGRQRVLYTQNKKKSHDVSVLALAPPQALLSSSSRLCPPPMVHVGGATEDEGGERRESSCFLPPPLVSEQDRGGRGGGGGAGGGQQEQLFQTAFEADGAHVAAAQRAVDVLLKEPPVVLHDLGRLLV